MENRNALLLRLPVALRKQVDIVARQNLRSTTRMIEYILSRYLASGQAA
jgi:hypothetical protein